MNNSLSFNRHQRKIRVALVSNYRLVLDSLRELLASTRDMSVTAACNESEALTESFEADVAVVYFEEYDDLQVIHDLQFKRPLLRVVAVISETAVENQLEALKLGAAGIVKKEQNCKFLFEAIRQTSKGEVWFNQSLLSRILKQNHNSKKSEKSDEFTVEALTAREIEVIQMIGEGLKNKSIAERLCISEATVRHHLSSIYGKLGVEDRLNLVILAYQNGLIEISGTNAEVY